MPKRRKPVVKKKKPAKKRVARKRAVKAVPEAPPAGVVEAQSGADADEDADRLTAKRRAFAIEYPKDHNATKAAERAGYAPDSAHVTGCRLLKNAKVAELIEDAERRAAIRAGIDTGYVVDNTIEVLERCLQRAPVMVRRGKYIVQLTDEDENDVWRFDAKGASSALALLAKHTGGFSERHEHTGKDGGPIEVADADKIRERISSRISGIASRMGTNGVSAKPHARRAGAA